MTAPPGQTGPVSPGGAAGRGFSLRHLAHQVWDSLGGADYHVLAKEIDRRLASRKDRDAALSEALIVYCREFAVNQRPKINPAGAGQVNSARSAKVAGVRRAWPQLRARIYTPSGQKALAECTYEDLLFHADLLETQAAQLQAKAGRERDLAAALRQHKAPTVADLPDAVLAQFFLERS